MINAIGASALLAIALTTPGSAQLVAPALPSPQLVNGGNLWTITAFDDSSPVHTQLATQSICFEFVGVVGTHVRYRWRSTTFPDWNGRATQEGDQVFMHGDYAKDVGHDGMEWSIASAKTGAGHWFEWREDGGFGITIGFANAEWQRVGSCPVTGVLTPVPPSFAADGTLIEDPFGRTQKQ
jgi:hypothetical protein